MALYLGPGEAGLRLDRLRDAWNQLYADGVGRGLTPPPGVPTELSQEIGAKFALWRQWYEENAQSLSDAAALHFGSPFAQGLDQWTDEYAVLRGKLVRAQVPTTAPPVIPLKNVAAPSVPTIATVTGTALFVLGLVYVLRVSR